MVSSSAISAGFGMTDVWSDFVGETDSNVRMRGEISVRPSATSGLRYLRYTGLFKALLIFFGAN